MYPEDSIQWLVSSWLIKDDDKKVCRGRILWSCVPHIDQQPMQLVPEGRTDPTDHTRASYRVEPFRIMNPPKLPTLPVAALPHFESERRLVYRAKRRPVLVVSTCGEDIGMDLRVGGVKWQTAPTFLVAPYYGVMQDEKRAGWQPELVKRIRRCEYPQYLWDKLPIPGSTESILRLDHIQPIGKHHNAYEWTPYHLSEEAIDILDEWILWLLTGRLKKDGILSDIRQELLRLD